MDKYWVAFSSIDSIDSGFIKRLYDYFGDIKSAWECEFKELKNIDGLSVKTAETFLKKRDKSDVDKLFQEVVNRGLKYLTFDNPDYPKLLKQIENPPMILYIKGDLKSCNLDKTLAVVGSRRASNNAKDSLNKILTELHDTDITIVSGLATGIDSSAHKFALENNLKTIGVVGNGLDTIYPPNNRELYDKIENGGGAVLSEYYPTFLPLPFRFPQRNRIVSGLSYGVLVAEAAIKSGALITANLCLEQGRELMCIPGLISNPNTQGIYKLLKQGATMVTSADDILEALNWEVKKSEQIKLNLENFSEDEKLIIKSIEIEPKKFDIIASETGINLDTLLVNLTSLELVGIIKQIDGEKYQLI